MNVANDLIENALRLPRADRSYLAAKLIESLDDGAEVSAEQIAEFDRRVEKRASGESAVVEREDLHAEIKSIFG